MFPVVDRFSAYGKLGLYRGETEDNTNFGPSAKETNTDITSDSERAMTSAS
jgi:hypothetical protein